MRNSSKVLNVRETYQSKTINKPRKKKTSTQAPVKKFCVRAGFKFNLCFWWQNWLGHFSQFWLKMSKRSCGGEMWTWRIMHGSVWPVTPPPGQPSGQVQPFGPGGRGWRKLKISYLWFCEKYVSFLPRSIRWLRSARLRISRKKAGICRRVVG